ncbi:MAG: sulfide/dihydroorotate dehydrogenase-like FAD/NAD-binding protein, partial [Candidatus Aminicenantes bacterium]|nr:sulfide/dihydroorotate dehydrogenase-like FAD/NAD-binding protein [Candidatus Aminicenantes bacterium]
MPKIIRRERLVPNLHLIEVEAPDIARKSKPGQFVIIMPDEFGERIPLSIADWDVEKGTVTAVFLVIGTSTNKLSRLNAGDEVPVFVGPLGKASEIKKYGTVVCAGGCFGIGAIYPVTRALKEAGNKIITLMDVKANYLLYWEDKFRAISDEFYVSSRDSYYDCKDYIPTVLNNILKKGETIDRVVSIGCTYLMYTCAEATRAKKIDT